MQRPGQPLDFTVEGDVRAAAACFDPHVGGVHRFQVA
jgi:hypothetical protein